MDATLHGCHPAIRQSWAPNNAGGAAELKGTIPPPKTDEAPTSSHYTNQAQLFLISTGEGGPGSVADGKTVTLTAVMSRSTLPAARSAGARRDSEVLRARPVQTPHVRAWPRPETHLIPPLPLSGKMRP